ncbi:pectinesterase 1 [Diospyros lotus]|uniref:pectinesterase 1 n=1 Tax=Diospyros lotus TaxID=55363 RepID=UPI00224CE257|nr:pectinesterase 1 [Diospyros lotus]
MMDSINFLKGYGKVNPVEDHKSPPANPTPTPSPSPLRKPVIAALSLITVLTIILVAFIGALAYDSLTESPESESTESVCSVTQFPHSCFASISALDAEPDPDPEIIFNLSLRVAANELRNLSSLPKILISKSNDPKTESALRDCVELFGDALSELSKSAAAMQVGGGERMLTAAKIGDLKTWISAAMSDQETCLDGLEEMGSTAVNEVRAKVQRSREYMSNSLAILSNMDALLAKFKLTIR